MTTANIRNRNSIFMIFLLFMTFVLTWDYYAGTNIMKTNNIVNSLAQQYRFGGEYRETRDSAPTPYLIEETDRFLWYQKKKDDFLSESPNNRLWEKFDMEKDVKMYLFNAYEFDYEYSISHLTPKIQGADVFCRYFDGNNKELGNPVQSFTFPDYLINCPKRKGTKKISISMTRNGSYESPQLLIDRKSKDLKYGLSMCLSPIYGDEPKWLMLIEMIEHYKLQGVQHFYFYVFQIDEYTNATIQNYVKSGEVEVIVIVDQLKRIGSDFPRMTYRDCTMRSRGESKWTIFADIDERLTMSSGTILDFMNTLVDEMYAGIVFRQRWIMKTEFLPKKFEGKQQILDWMPTRRWHNTSGVGAPGHTIKCLVDTKKVFLMWTHYPKIYYGSYKLYDLKPEEGVVRHYRDLSLGSWGKTWLKDVARFGPFENTDYPKHLMDQLTENVMKKAIKIYGNGTLS